MQSLARSAWIFLIAGLGSGLGACFIEAAQPSTFRFECSSNGECNDGDVCSDGLCQTPCGAGLEACEGSSICLNGFCSNICPTDEDVCPDPQECVALSEDPENTSGVCTILCDDADHPCGDGQLCVVGFCVTPCMGAEDCADGEECTEAAPGVSVCMASSSSGSGFP